MRIERQVDRARRIEPITAVNMDKSTPYHVGSFEVVTSTGIALRFSIVDIRLAASGSAQGLVNS